jgi:hypothetical protein
MEISAKVLAVFDREISSRQSIVNELILKMGDAATREGTVIEARTELALITRLRDAVQAALAG